MKPIILAVLFSIALFGQSTLSIVNPASPAPLYSPGAVIALNVTKANLPTSTAIQFDVSTATGTVSVAAGPVVPSSKAFQCSPTAPVTCIAAGFNVDVIPDGVIAIVTVTLPPAISSSPVNVSISSPVIADKDGHSVQVALGNPTVPLLIKSGCDVNGDGSVGSADFFAVVNGVIGHIVSTSTDLNKDGKTNALDAQIVGTAGTGPLFTCNAN